MRVFSPSSVLRSCWDRPVGSNVTTPHGTLVLGKELIDIPLSVSHVDQLGFGFLLVNLLLGGVRVIALFGASRLPNCVDQFGGGLSV